MKTMLTNSGKRILLGGISGEKIIFTRAEFGNGLLDDVENRATISNPIVSTEFTSDTVIQTDNYVSLKTLFTNEKIDAPFRITEIGYFAKLDGEENDVLYAYITFDETEADRVPAVSERLMDIEHEQFIYIGDTANISAVLSGSTSYALKKDFDDHLTKANPHGVTKEQVGLGDVPNERAEDQTVMYEATTLAALKSGEKIKTAFAKIKTAVDSIINHLKDTKNPHKVTAKQTGAAPKEHTHGASNITSGILGVQRGGTGVDSLDTLAEKVCKNFGAAKVVTGTFEIPGVDPSSPEYNQSFTSTFTLPGKMNAIIANKYYNASANYALNLFACPGTGKTTGQDPDIYTGYEGWYIVWGADTTTVKIRLPASQYGHKLDYIAFY